MISTQLTREELDQWYTMRIQYVNGYHVSDWDHKEMARLNFLILEASQAIHNENMLRKGK